MMNDELEWNRARLWKISEITWRWWMLYSLTRSLFLAPFLCVYIYIVCSHANHMSLISPIFIPFTVTVIVRAYQKIDQTSFWIKKFLLAFGFNRKWNVANEEKSLDIKNLLSSLWWNQSGFLLRFMFAYTNKRLAKKKVKNSKNSRWQRKIEENWTDLCHFKSIESPSIEV